MLVIVVQIPSIYWLLWIIIKNIITALLLCLLTFLFAGAAIYQNNQYDITENTL